MDSLHDLFIPLAFLEQVLIRVRPLNDREIESGPALAVPVCVQAVGRDSVQLLSHAGPPLEYKFDFVAGEMASQDKVFRVAGRPIVDNVMRGYNSSIFAYGQVRRGSRSVWLTSLPCCAC